MKKICITFLTFLIIMLSAVGFACKNSETYVEYLRIHIRADSNDDAAQAVKYLVKDAVVEFLTPIIAECKTKIAAETALQEKLGEVERTANEVLFDSGFDYVATAKIRNELFPTRVYGGLTLSDGYYDALIIELGSGKGDNWWCVVYPPLCFTEGNGNGYAYKSKIYEIITDFFKFQQKEEK